MGYKSGPIIDAVFVLIYQAFMVVLPSLLISLAVTTVVAIIMAAMQVQEQSLSFLPKLFAIAFGFFILGDMMFNNLVTTIRDFIATSLSII